MFDYVRSEEDVFKARAYNIVFNIILKKVAFYIRSMK